jgi:hypothetical protein
MTATDLEKLLDTLPTFFEAGINVTHDSDMRWKTDVGSSGSEKLLELAVVHDIARSVAFRDPFGQPGARQK